MHSKTTIMIFIAIVLLSPLAAFIAPELFGSGFSMANAQEGQQEAETHPTYWIYINPGATGEALQHYSPNYIAVPAGITLQWFNNDLGQMHTVTSGRPGDLDSGSLFNSGSMPFGADFQLTFENETGLVGDLPYYCTIHPWVTGMISVNEEVVTGNSFEMASGTGPIIDLAKDNRTIFIFKPIEMPENEISGQFPENPVFYSIALLRNSDNETIFSDTFQPQGINLQIELIQSDTATSSPTVSIDTGGAHITGNNVFAPGNYTLVTEITNIGASPPPQQMKDEFEIQVLSNSTQ